MRNGLRSACGLLALRGQLLLGHVAAIGGAALEQPVGDLGVARPELRLVIFVPVPIEAEPAHPVEDRVDRLLGRARLVGVLDPQQELAAVVAGEQPVEQRRARAADVQEAGRRGREAGDDRPRSYRLRSSALSSSLHAAMQWTSAPNIGEAPLPQRARGYWKTRFSAAREELEQLLEAERAQLPPWFVVGFGSGHRRLVRARRSRGSGRRSCASAAALALVGFALGSGRAGRALGWFALAATLGCALVWARSDWVAAAAARAAVGRRSAPARSRRSIISPRGRRSGCS